MNILSCLKGFIATVDCKSFSKAAQKLYISPSKLSKQITWLEEELKVTLLIRSTTRLIVTESGHRLYEKALDLFEQLEVVKVIATPDQFELNGIIRLYLTVTPAIPYLTSLSIQFMRKYPGIEIDFIVGSDTKSSTPLPLIWLFHLMMSNMQNWFAKDYFQSREMSLLHLIISLNMGFLRQSTNYQSIIV